MGKQSFLFPQDSTWLLSDKGLYSNGLASHLGGGGGGGGALHPLVYKAYDISATFLSVTHCVLSSVFVSVGVHSCCWFGRRYCTSFRI